MTEFYDTNGNLMVPLRCQLCGEQIGVKDRNIKGDEEWLVARCYACAATEEAETILSANKEKETSDS